MTPSVEPIGIPDVSSDTSRHSSNGLGTSKFGLVLITPDFEWGLHSEFALTREKLNEIIKYSRSAHRLVIWEESTLLSSPFQQLMQTFQKHNVHGIFILLRFHTGQKNMLSQLRNICMCLWAKRIFAVNEGCPALPVLVMVHGAKERSSAKQILKRKIRLLLVAGIPNCLVDLDLIKIQFVWSSENAARITENAAHWLKTTAKWYKQRLAGRPIWNSMNWEKIFRREVQASWQDVAKALTTTVIGKEKKTSRPTRSQSEPIVIPRRRPLIADEVLISHGEEAAAIAAQLRHYSTPGGIRQYRHPRAKYLYGVFQELVTLRETVRLKLIQKRQHYRKMVPLQMMQARSSGGRFYTRFQWIKSHSGDKTSRLIIYFHYGSIVQYSVARMKEPLSPCDIQLLRGQLLSHSQSRRDQTTMANARTLCQLWTKMQSPTE